MRGLITAPFVLAATCGMADTTYRYFRVTEQEERVVRAEPITEKQRPRWARDVVQEMHRWPQRASDRPLFCRPIRFVRAPVDAGEPFYPHNHQPAITWLANGDLLAIWYATRKEAGTELTVMASRLRHGAEEWDPASVFFKADNHNMHGSSIVHDGHGTIYHLNGMAPTGVRGWSRLAMLLRTSRDNGVTWSGPDPACPIYRQRHQVIAGTVLGGDGLILQPCDAVPGGAGGTALQISRDCGRSWQDPGAGKPLPDFANGAGGQGTIAGIHAGVVLLRGGGLLAFGRGDSIDHRMPMSLSGNMGATWTYAASEFPAIGSGQRLVLQRLREGPLLFISFTGTNTGLFRGHGLDFAASNGSAFRGYGLFAAVSYDEGKTWPTRKLLTPGDGTYDGGGWTGQFTATPDHAEPAGYLAATQTPDGIIHLLTSALYYRFNLAWLKQPTTPPAHQRATTGDGPGAGRPVKQR